VLVAGGYNSGSGYLTSAEVFNPATNTFSLAGIGSMATARHRRRRAASDGRVLQPGYLQRHGLRHRRDLQPGDQPRSARRGSGQ
jgi:hypothetical protein